MKISLLSVAQIPLGKHSVKDARLDEVDKITRAKKKTYVQVELACEAEAVDADAVLVSAQNQADAILKDLEFVEARLSRASDDTEKALLGKLKDSLGKEEFIFTVSLTADEKKAISGYGLLTNRPVVVAGPQEQSNKDALLARALKESGFISFFTTGEKETRAWLIRKGTSAWEAAGVVHSDIQKGFIRAEIISFDDFIHSGGEAQAKQAGKMRLESKGYVIQDADLVNFRFNK